MSVAKHQTWLLITPGQAQTLAESLVFPDNEREVTSTGKTFAIQEM